MFQTTSTLLVVMLMTSLVTAATMVTPRHNVTCGDSLALQSLLTLVQHQMKTQEQQAATIQTLQGHLTSLQGTVTALQTTILRQSLDINQVKATATDVSKHVTERMDSFHAQLKAKAERGQVAFTAHMSSTGVNVGSSGPFIFDVVTTNIGDAYNPHSGIFVAPYDGVYVFNFIMINDGNAQTIHAQIEKDGQVLGVGTSDGLGEANKWDDGSALVTTRLMKGDHVYVKRRDGGTRVYGNVYTNFSGFLLAADA